MQHLLEEAGERGNLPRTVRICGGDRDAGADVDVHAMALVLFCGVVAERESFLPVSDQVVQTGL